jgi:molybdenum cofactor guanylyltransferase
MGEPVRAAGFLLCGGRSSRMGTDKALLVLDGEPLVQRGLRLLGEVCVEVAIAGGGEELRRFGRIVPDEAAGCGPLGGIVSAMRTSDFDWNLFLAVDTPFVPVSVLNRLLGEAAASDAVAVMARVAGQVQPLCAMYSGKALPQLTGELAAGNWKITEAVAAAGGYEIVDFEDERWFRNLNTPAEFAEAERGIG